MEKIITINSTNIEKEHICCAISDKKCQESYELKKEWLRKEFENGYVFKRLDARAKVFIEYGPAENSWAPVYAPGYLLLNCLWVSGQYKGVGYGKLLLQHAIDDAINQGKYGLATIAGTSKFHFMSDTKWLLRQGFQSCQDLPYGFSLLVKKLKPDAEMPRFNNCVLLGECPDKEGIVVYYSNRCPYTEFHVRVSLSETAYKRSLPLKIYKLETIA